MHVDGEGSVNKLALIDQEGQLRPVDWLRFQLAEGAVVGGLNTGFDELKVEFDEGQGKIGEQVADDLCLASDVVVEQDELFLLGLGHQNALKYYKLLCFSSSISMEISDF